MTDSAASPYRPAIAPPSRCGGDRRMARPGWGRFSATASARGAFIAAARADVGHDGADWLRGFRISEHTGIAALRESGARQMACMHVG